MGRHRDSDTLEFIKWLENKGVELGYQSKTEYPVGNNEYFIDVVWKYPECSTPLITFEVDRAEKLFFEGFSLLGGVNAKLRMQLALYWSGGMAALKEIRKVDYDVLNNDTGLSSISKAGVVLSSLMRWIQAYWQKSGSNR